MNIKGNIDIKGIKDPQAFEMIREGFKIVPTKEQMKAILELLSRIEQDLIMFKKSHDKWHLTKVILTPKQKDKLLEDL